MLIVKLSYTTTAFVFLLNTFSAAQADEDKILLPLATCQESWMDWQKQSPEKGDLFVDTFQANYHKDEGQNFYIPIRPTSILGHEISGVSPNSIGLGAGFSVAVKADFEAVKSSLEQQMGKAFIQCDSSINENIKSCQYEINKGRTVALMSNTQDENKQSIFGCYYYTPQNTQPSED